MIPYSRHKRSDLYTLSWSKLLENHTLHSGTYLYSPSMAVPPPPPGPSFLSHYKTLSVVSVPGIERTTSRSAIKHSTDWPNSATVSSL